MSSLPDKIDDRIKKDDEGLNLENCGYGIALLLCYISLALVIGGTISAHF